MEFETKETVKTLHPTTMQPCLNCKTEFKPTNGWHKYCQRKCKWNYSYKINPRPGGKPTTEEHYIRRRIASKKYYELNKETIRAKEKARRASRVKFGSCPICLTEATLVSDHHHATGERRLYICNHCNLALGHVKENIQILRNLINYLEEKPWKNI